MPTITKILERAGGLDTKGFLDCRRTVMNEQKIGYLQKVSAKIAKDGWESWAQLLLFIYY